MSVHYLILGHKQPKQIRLLIEQLEHSQASFYIHIDARVNVSSFRDELIGFERVYFVDEENRKETLWGDISLVEATLVCLKLKLRNNSEGHTVLMSGQDFPLHSTERIHQFFQNHPKQSFLDYFELPYDHWNNKGLDRVEYYNFHNKTWGRDYISVEPFSLNSMVKLQTWKQSVKLILKTGFKYLPLLFSKRKTNFPISKWYGGPQWWTLSAQCVDKIMIFLKEHPEYIDFHKHSHVPDELFFHTLVLNLEPKASISSGLTYINWHRKDCVLPVTFTSQQEDILELKEAQKNHLFVRKVDIDLDENCLKSIKNQIIKSSDLDCDLI